MRHLLDRIVFWLRVDITCSWCHRPIHKAPMPRGGWRGTSHGICPSCSRRVYSEVIEFTAKH